VAVSQPKTQQNSQVSSDSRAQVEALEGSEDPTYTSYRRVLKQYLGQRLEAKAEFQGTVRLKIKLEYGSVATSVNIIESSGNLQVDNWAKTAALAASPYPKIPKEIGSTFEFSPTLQLGKPK
jgi:TonB family protein